MPPDDHQVRQLNFNMRPMGERAAVGVRRAAAFLGISERVLEQGLPRSLTLGKAVKMQFLPDPFPEDHVAELADNWRSWITGNALRELDQFLSLYLDDAYDFVQQAKVYSGVHAANFQWNRIDRQTNVADKYRDVLSAMEAFDGVHVERHDCLVTLSKVRNCLSHDLGIVTPKRAGGQPLTVRWISLKVRVEQGDSVFVLNELNDIADLQLDPELESLVSVQVVTAEKAFAVGEHARFSADELLEICLFYQMVFDEAGRALDQFVRESGVDLDG